MEPEFIDKRGRKTLLAALRTCEAKRRAFLNATSDAAVLLDLQGSILEANEKAAEVLHTPMAKLMGARIFDVLPPAFARLLSARLVDVFRTGRPVRWEDSLGDKTICVNAHPVLRPRGSFSATAVFAKDLTEQRRTEEQFYQAQKMETVGRFAGNVVHDIRNQMSVIKGYGEMLQRRSLIKPDGQNMVAEILKATDKSAELAGQVLTFSRKEAFQPRQIDMVKSIAEIAKALPGMLGESIRLSVAEDVHSCWINVDPNRLQHAIFNLAINARDAMPRGGRLSIRTSLMKAGADFVSVHPGSRPGRYCAVTISDTGHGVDRATLGKLFEPFFTTKEPGRGGGLGLAMVRAFVRQSNGFIDVESEPAKGTTFRLYFPCDETTGNPERFN